MESLPDDFSHKALRFEFEEGGLAFSHHDDLRARSCETAQLLVRQGKSWRGFLWADDRQWVRLEGKDHDRPTGNGGEQTGLGEELLVGKMDPVKIPDRQHRLSKRWIDRL